MIRTVQLKRRSPLRRVSPKRAKLNRVYFSTRKEYLSTHPRCELKCGRRSCDVHHVNGRLVGRLVDESGWLALCRTCHEVIHRYPKAAREMGLLR